MSVELNGIAHIQLTVRDASTCLPFWESLCHFLDMKTLIKGEDTIYCIGSRTGILVRTAAAEDKPDDLAFNQWRAGLHHFCLRARKREDVDAVHHFAVSELSANIVHPPQEDAFAPGYYSVLFEDPEGIRIEINHVPGRGHLGNEGRLGDGGPGPGEQHFRRRTARLEIKCAEDDATMFQRGPCPSSTLITLPVTHSEDGAHR